MQDTIKYGRFKADFSFEDVDVFKDNEVLFVSDYDNDELLDLVVLLLKVRILRNKYQEIADDDIRNDVEQSALQEASEIEAENERSL